MRPLCTPQMLIQNRNMKKLLFYAAFAVVVLTAGCSKYDDTEIQNRLGSLESRVAKLEELCKQMNTNISSLQTLVAAMQNNDFITGVAEIKEGGTVVGYTITFSKSPSITLYHGKDGAKGDKGDTGDTGAKGDRGDDGYTPVIGVREDADGVWYWTLDGEWLTDGSGNRVRAQGSDGADGAQGDKGDRGDDGANGEQGDKGDKGDAGEAGAKGDRGDDGITPQLKIEDDYWYISYDEGATWQKLGKATGENGKDGKDGKNGAAGAAGDSFFRSIDTSSDDYVVITLADGTQFSLPRYSRLAIAFDEEGLVAMRPNSTRSIGYTVTGGATELSFEVLCSGDVKAKIEQSSPTAGVLVVTTGAVVDEYSRVVLLVSDGDKTVMGSIAFEAPGLRVTGGSVYEVSAAGGFVEAAVETNWEYSVSIPVEAQSWVSLVSTRAWRSETVVLQIAENEEGLERTATVDLVDENGTLYESIIVRQEDFHVADPMEQMFPDPVFREYVLREFDADGDGMISDREARNVTKISVSKAYATPVNERIASLEGIQHFTALTELRCGYNDLTTLDLGACRMLTYLDCSSNRLTGLNVSGCTALQTLYCNSNLLTELDLSGNTALTTIDCESNLLVRLDISRCTKLSPWSFFCGYNHLEVLNLGNASVASLDLSRALEDSKQLKVAGGRITSLNVGNNNLESLDVNECPALEELLCFSNKLTMLDVSKTNLGRSSLEYPLDCAPMPTLETLVLKSGWQINGINVNYSPTYMAYNAEIVYAN